MSIQANINQTMSLAGLLFSQTPIAEEGKIAAQHKREVKEAKRGVNLAGQVETEALEKYEEVADEIGKKEGLTEAQKDASLMETAEYQIWKETMSAETKAHSRLAELEPTEANISGMVNRRRAELEQAEIEQKAKDALAAEQKRIANSNKLTDMYDLSKLHEGPRARVDRAIKKAERDTKYLTKKEDSK